MNLRLIGPSGGLPLQYLQKLWQPLISWFLAQLQWRIAACSLICNVKNGHICLVVINVPHSEYALKLLNVYPLPQHISTAVTSS